MDEMDAFRGPDLTELLNYWYLGQKDGEVKVFVIVHNPLTLTALLHFLASLSEQGVTRWLLSIEMEHSNALYLLEYVL
jgi:hypothetical protein